VSRYSDSSTNDEEGLNLGTPLLSPICEGSCWQFWRWIGARTHIVSPLLSGFGVASYRFGRDGD